MRAGWPAGVMPAQDPWALRILTLVCLAAAFGFVGGDAGDRLGRALAPSFAAARTVVPVSVDMWIEPPAYTGRPALFAGARGTGFDLPEGSKVHARVTGVDGEVLAGRGAGQRNAGAFGRGC